MSRFETRTHFADMSDETRCDYITGTGYFCEERATVLLSWTHESQSDPKCPDFEMSLCAEHADEVEREIVAELGHGVLEMHPLDDETSMQ